MNFSKKLIVSSLASVMAVSLVGAITGTVAWYQYNTRVTTSLIGMNVAETGILEISATSNSTGFKRDLTTADLLTASGRTDFNLTPVTFAGGNVTAAALPTVESALKAYKNPDKSSKVVVEDGSDYATRGSYASNWDEADKTNDYIQYALYVRAREVDKVSGGFTQTAEDVYLTDYVLEALGSPTKDITEAMRIHLAIDADGNGEDDTWFLLSKSAVSGIALHGMLDQDNDGIADRIGGYEWAAHRDDHIDYAKGNDYTETATTLADQKATRDSSNNYAIASADAAKKLFTTPTTGATRITVTIWVEGWDKNLGDATVTSYSFAATDPAPTVGTTEVTSLFENYKLGASTVANNYVQSKGDAGGKAVAGVTYYTRTANAATKVPSWNGFETDEATFKFGLTFDIGRDTFKD